MGKKYVTNTEIIGTGCVVFIVAFLALGIPTMFDMYFLLATPAFVVAMLPALTVGILIGKYVIQTRLGIWLGAILGVIIGYLLFFSVISKMSFD